MTPEPEWVDQQMERIAAEDRIYRLETAREWLKAELQKWGHGDVGNAIMELERMVAAELAPQK